MSDCGMSEKARSEPLAWIEECRPQIETKVGLVRFEPWDHQKEIISRVAAGEQFACIHASMVGVKTAVMMAVAWLFLVRERFNCHCVGEKMRLAERIIDRLRVALRSAHGDYAGARYRRDCVYHIDGKRRVTAYSTWDSHPPQGEYPPDMIFADDYDWFGESARTVGPIREFINSPAGAVVVATTPGAKNQRTLELITRGQIQGLFLNWHAVPTRDEAWERKQRGAMGDKSFEQEYVVQSPIGAK